MQSLYSALQAYWNLQDASGSRLDLTGNANTLTNTGTVTSVDGFLGQASNFVAASSQRLQIASNATIQGGAKSYTFVAWVRLTSKPANNMSLISKYSATSGQAEYDIFWDQVHDSFDMQVYVATDNAILTRGITFGTPGLSTWYFVNGWYDNTLQTVNIETNMTGADSISLGGSAQAASAAVMALGSRGATGTLYFDGRMAEVGKWDRVLTTTERAWLYNSGRGRTFPFDGGFSLALGRHQRGRRGGLLTP